MTTARTIGLQATGCPACPLPAEIVDRAVLESTDGPVEHARVRCVAAHVFNLPVAMLAAGASAPAPAPRHRRTTC